MLSLEYSSNGRITAADQSTKDILKRGFFGVTKGSEYSLLPEEALYLIDVRNAECKQGSATLSFNTLSSRFYGKAKFAARYFTYKDWRDRGLVIKNSASVYPKPSRIVPKEYPKATLELPRYKLHGVFFDSDLVAIVEDETQGKDIYEKLWFGQYGTYKASERGHLNKLDIYETLFLFEKKVLVLDNITKSDLIRIATRRRSDFKELYGVYKDWREHGYVIKTGFKFGTHFRVYFPGAKPIKAGDDEWVHSKHVLHVFPKGSRLLTSEWARAIRVAHSVRKTFILAVPGKSRDKKVDLDYILFHRKGGEAESPENDAPRYAMLSLGEDEYIGGSEFAGALRESKQKGLELIVAIADRETAVTYYKVKQIRLPGSANEYYEIDWLQP